MNLLQKVHCVTHIAAEYSSADIWYSLYQLSVLVFNAQEVFHVLSSPTISGYLSVIRIRLIYNQLSLQWDIQSWISLTKALILALANDEPSNADLAMPLRRSIQAICTQIKSDFLSVVGKHFKRVVWT